MCTDHQDRYMVNNSPDNSDLKVSCFHLYISSLHEYGDRFKGKRVSEEITTAYKIHVAERAEYVQEIPGSTYK